MPLPNFLIIGAAKAGTTSLYYYLRQHPQVYMSPIKEPRFFALEGEILNFKGPAQGINQTSITSLDEYFHLFAGVTDEIAIGEASTLYLHSQRALEGIKRYLPNAKLIVILRNPIERAYSSYLHLVRDGYEALSFEQALQAEEFRIQQKWQPLWYYSKRSFYYEAIKNYLDIFEHCQIKIYLYEDLAADSKYIFKDICGFLDIDDSFKPDTSIKNSSGIPKNKFLQRILISDNPAKIWT